MFKMFVLDFSKTKSKSSVWKWIHDSGAHYDNIKSFERLFEKILYCIHAIRCCYYSYTVQKIFFHFLATRCILCAIVFFSTELCYCESSRLHERILNRILCLWENSTILKLHYYTLSRRKCIFKMISTYIYCFFFLNSKKNNSYFDYSVDTQKITNV